MAERKTYSPTVYDPELYKLLVSMGATPNFVQREFTPEEIAYFDALLEAKRESDANLAPLPPPDPVIRTSNHEIAQLYARMGKKVILIGNEENDQENNS